MGSMTIWSSNIYAWLSELAPSLSQPSPKPKRQYLLLSAGDWLTELSPDATNPVLWKLR